MKREEEVDVRETGRGEKGEREKQRRLRKTRPCLYPERGKGLSRRVLVVHYLMSSCGETRKDISRISGRSDRCLSNGARRRLKLMKA
ncbi:hypothetical protein E2C01_056653 [Portunus trituberculatus]|uniref:Uncharacterized protein n=1 Tax=Portunus trituberculatus TaxID=210409 RepID=A0A5B7GZR4_PORTR|nr:hypothetical protein [Portunus trituberculatus]